VSLVDWGKGLAKQSVIASAFSRCVPAGVRERLAPMLGGGFEAGGDGPRQPLGATGTPTGGSYAGTAEAASKVLVASLGKVGIAATALAQTAKSDLLACEK
jgi:hypothetical protein